MKITIFYTSLVTGLFLSSTTFAAPVSGGGAAAPAASAVAPRTGIVPSTGTTPTGTQPGAVPHNQITPNATSQSSATTNFFPNTNGLAGTNGFPTNGLVGMSNNPSSVTATINPASNGFVNPNTDINGNMVVGDQTVTSSDRVLLTTLSQGVKASLGITPNGNLPVHFMINNGTVTVVGTVQSSAQSQSILSQVQQTPGVLNVVNGLQVASPMATAQSQTASANSVFAGPTDHAFSPRDQTLLTTVQQQAAMQLGVNVASQMPVHFSIQGGVVGVSGQLPSLQEKQALLAAIARTPGIVRVVDNVGVLNGAAGMGLTTPPTGATMNGNLPATSRTPSGSNTIFLNSNNASGF